MSFRAAIPYVIGGAILIGASFVILGDRAQKRFEEGQTFEKEGKLADAIERYEWAVQAYTPLGSYPALALDRLAAIAQEAEVAGATETAIEAWQSVVSGLAVIENFRQPFESELREAETRLENLRGNDTLIPSGNIP
jgi:hypothetical protein